LGKGGFQVNAVCFFEFRGEGGLGRRGGLGGRFWGFSLAPKKTLDPSGKTRGGGRTGGGKETVMLGGRAGEKGEIGAPRSWQEAFPQAGRDLQRLCEVVVGERLGTIWGAK